MNVVEYIDRVNEYSITLEELSKAFHPEDQAYRDLLGQFEKLKGLAANSTDPAIKAHVEQLGQKLAAHTQMRRGARTNVLKDRRQLGQQLGAERVERRGAERRATTDPLTGLSNQEGYRGNQAASKGAVYVAIDLTHFKDVNDTFGHPGGDQALRNVGALLTSSLKEAGLSPKDAHRHVHRTGGDEFVVMLRTPQQAARYARAFRNGLANMRHTYAQPPSGFEGDAAGDSIQASATLGIGRSHEEADVAAAVAKRRKNERVRAHLSSLPFENQVAARKELLRAGSINGEPLFEAHSLLPGLDGPLDENDTRWQAPHAKRPLSSSSVKQVRIDPITMPKPIDSGMREQAPTQVKT